METLSRTEAPEAVIRFWDQTIFHCPSEQYLSRKPDGTYLFRLRIHSAVPVRKIFLRTAPDGHEETYQAWPASPVSGYDSDWWEVGVHVRGKQLAYRFLIITDWGSRWLNAAGCSRRDATDHDDFKMLFDRQLPGWPLQTVFYQILPDRFAAGRSCGLPRPDVDGQPAVLKPWSVAPDPADNWRSFYGGDLWGIAEKLDYLERLGIGSLYLTPVFQAPSSHKYDVSSYDEVDPHFGGNEALAHLRQQTDERGLRLVLDMIPNHCGYHHPWFQQAIRDPNAPTAQFFKFYEYPKSYECWFGFGSLPKLSYRSQRLRNEMYDGEEAVLRKWLRAPYALDGWRLDVANMVGRLGEEQFGHKILRGMRRAIKQENPDAYLIGEHFFDATTSLQGDELDAVMNYRAFMMPLYHWLNGRSFDDFLDPDGCGDPNPLDTPNLCRTWQGFLAKIPWEMALRQLNLLDSHDCPRMLTVLNRDRQLAAVARLLLFTFPGVPSVYYGDELGLTGGKDPANRQTMPWPVEDSGEVFDEWRRLIAWRRSAPALQSGALQFLLAEQQTIAFLREHPSQRLLVVARRQADPLANIPMRAGAVPDGSIWKEWFSQRQVRVVDGQLAVGDSLCQIWEEVL